MADVPLLALLALQEARAAGLTIVTAESCTGGLVAAALTDIPGSSDVFDRGFVTYSNAAKTEMLGVPTALIERHGAVSREVAGAMAQGALAHSPANLSVAVTGIAGPGGGTAEKPVGLVHFAAARQGRGVTRVEMRYAERVEAPNRQLIRLLSVETALGLLKEMAHP